MTNDARQQLEWVMRGRYPIGIGVSDGVLVDFRQEGLALNVREIREAGTLSTGVGGLQLISRAPHPNAAKVFVNWLLSREVQQRVSSQTGQNSRRLDVPAAEPANAPDPAKVHEYVANQVEAFLPVRERAQQLAAELLR
jgi:iron(III) transport system substrate-binding protein